MATLVSVNVGLPKDIPWHDPHRLHRRLPKTPVDGSRMVRRLNVDGDGQGDLGGHESSAPSSSTNSSPIGTGP